MTIDVEPEAVRVAMLDQLQVEVAKREDMFLPWVGCGEAELNSAAIAEWAWGLLERQKEAILAIVERELRTKDEETNGSHRD